LDCDGVALDFDNLADGRLSSAHQA
jgi:hypothetical protein